MPLIQPALTKQGDGTDLYVRQSGSGDINATSFTVSATPGGATRAQLGFDGTDGYVACASGQRLYFGGAAGLPGQSYIQPAATINDDALVIGGSVSAQELKLPTGVDGAMGTATLVAGQAIVNTTACLGVNSFIFLTRTNLNASTALGDLRIQNKLVGQFTITSSTMSTPPPLSPEVGDLSDVQWVIINPA